MLHTHTKTITVTETVIVCDCCGREMLANDQDFEHQERIAIRFRAGYGSVFGDGSLVEADLCQHCLRDVLGKFLRVTLDDPRDPQHHLRSPAEARRAYQEYQLRQVIGAEELLKNLREALQKRLNEDAS
ncbi:MAG: hypothetical protein ACLPXB_07555 [Thiobacillaceae bacterium]